MNNEAIDKELQENNNHPKDGQGNEQFDYEKGYKSLQPEFDKRNQILYDVAEKLVTKDFNEIHNIKDEWIKNKVIKKLYWFNSLEEYLAVKWNNNEDENADTELSKIKAELRLLKYNEEQKLISSYIKEKDVKDIDWFKENIKLFNPELSLEERLNKAFVLMPQKDLSMFDIYNWWIQVKPTVNVNKQDGKKVDLISEMFDKAFKK